MILSTNKQQQRLTQPITITTTSATNASSSSSSNASNLSAVSTAPFCLISPIVDESAPASNSAKTQTKSPAGMASSNSSASAAAVAVEEKKPIQADLDASNECDRANEDVDEANKENEMNELVISNDEDEETVTRESGAYADETKSSQSRANTSKSRRKSHNEATDDADNSTNDDKENTDTDYEQIDVLDQVYDYWKSFDIRKLKNDLNTFIDDIKKRQQAQDDVSTKCADLVKEIKKLVNEDVFKTVSPTLKCIQSDVESLSRRSKSNDSAHMQLFEMLVSVPDPFPVIDLVKSLINNNKSASILRNDEETDAETKSALIKQIKKLQNENTKLKDDLNEANLKRIEGGKLLSNGSDTSKLISSLSEQVTKTTSINMELTTKLKVSEGEIDSYKKILADYQAQLTEMTIKCLNETKNGNNGALNNPSLTGKENDSKLLLKKSDNVKSDTQRINCSPSSQSLLISPSSSSSSSSSSASSNMSPKTKNNSASLSPNNNAKSSYTTTTKHLNGANSNENSTQKISNLISQTSGGFTPSDSMLVADLIKKENDEANKNHENEEDETDKDDLANNEEEESISHRLRHKRELSSTNSNDHSETLDTAEIAQRVRDLLGTHNIGQRVFAKSILGLSQGTVSELLSKPKHWEKLTEKGRESYRKMNQWSLSKMNISTLKSISPRKFGKDAAGYSGQNGNVSSGEENGDDDAGDVQKSSSRDSPSRSALYRNRSSNQQSSSYNDEDEENDAEENDAVNDDQFEEEDRDDNDQQNSYDDENEEEADDDGEYAKNERHGAHKRSTGNVDDDLQNSSMSAYPLDLTVKTSNGPSYQNLNKKIKTEHQQLTNGDFADHFGGLKVLKNLPASLAVNQSVLSAVSNSNNSPFKVLAESYMNHFKDQFVAAAAVAAAMASASASASASPSPSSTSSVSSKSTVKSSSASSFNAGTSAANHRNPIAAPVHSSNNFRAQHFTRSSTTPSPALGGPLPVFPSNGGTVSTKQIKCTLPPVSQEQFDKYSQINTDDLVRKVKDLLSKFSISQRLFGECILGLSQGSVSDLLARPKPWTMLTQKGREPFIRMQMFIDDPEAIKRLMANQYKTTSINSDSSSSIASLATKVPAANKNYSVHGMPSEQGYNSLRLPLGSPQLFYNNHHSNTSSNNDNSNDSSENLKNSLNYQANSQPQVNIIPYDISQLSSVGELNTDEITNRVKETLLNNNIGQKLFGEAVLNLSQGTVSELLSKPKPWNTLSIKGREPYLRMYMWLNDSSRLEKLNEWKEEKNMLKRINAAETEAPTAASGDQQKPKRRFIFTEDQKDQLLKAFKYDPYPAVNQMELLATKLNLATRTVINWFHNHRMRIRYKSNSNSWSPNGSNTPVTNPYELSPSSKTSPSKNHHKYSANSAVRSSKNNSRLVADLGKRASLSNSLYANSGYNSKHGVNYDNGEDNEEDENDMSNENDGDMNQYDDEDMNNNNDNEEYYEMNQNDVDYDDDDVDTNNNNVIHSDEQDQSNDEHQAGDYYSNNYEYNEVNNEAEEEEEESVDKTSKYYKSKRYQEDSSSAALDDSQLILNNNKRRKPHNPQKLNASVNNLLAKKYQQQQS